MFTPDQLPAIAADLREAGLKLDPDKLNDFIAFPMAAVVSLGGCSASFVSPQGLVVANHHCARGSVQFHSKPERNYLDEGFLAASMTDELPAPPGTRVYVAVNAEDVTEGRRRSRSRTCAPRPLPGDGGPTQGRDEGMRVRPGPSVPGDELLRRSAIQADQVPRNPRRAPRVRTGGRHRPLRRRHRQLALAEAHGRLRLLPCVRLAGWRTRGPLAGQRPLRAGALPRGIGRRDRRRRLRDGDGLSRRHLALRPPCHRGEPVRAGVPPVCCEKP